VQVHRRDAQVVTDERLDVAVERDALLDLLDRVAQPQQPHERRGAVVVQVKIDEEARVLALQLLLAERVALRAGLAIEREEARGRLVRDHGQALGEQLPRALDQRGLAVVALALAVLQVVHHARLLLDVHVLALDAAELADAPAGQEPGVDHHHHVGDRERVLVLLGEVLAQQVDLLDERQAHARGARADELLLLQPTHRLLEDVASTRTAGRSRRRNRESCRAAR
jgi:hypothetical protein